MSKARHGNTVVYEILFFSDGLRIMKPSFSKYLYNTALATWWGALWRVDFATCPTKDSSAKHAKAFGFTRLPSSSRRSTLHCILCALPGVSPRSGTAHMGQTVDAHTISTEWAHQWDHALQYIQALLQIQRNCLTYIWLAKRQTSGEWETVCRRHLPIGRHQAERNSPSHQIQ